MVNDSAGIDVILVDKSQRPSSGDGFRAAVAIEAARGLCNKPTLISSTDEFVKVFGESSLDKYGQANVEAYFLAQGGVPLAISRAKNPSITYSDSLFGCLRVGIKDGKLQITDANMNAIASPAEKNTSFIYFKGEGNYCSKALPNGDSRANSTNVVLRFSEPPTKSAYANEKRAVQLQVYDFAGAKHLDVSTKGILGLTPSLDPVLGGDSSGSPADALYLQGYVLDFSPDAGPSSGASSGEAASAQGESSEFKSTVNVFVNGYKGTADYNGESVYDCIVAAIKDAVLESHDVALLPLMGITSNGDGTFSVSDKCNCFDLSISVSIYAKARGIVDLEDAKFSVKPKSAYLNYGCGTVGAVPDADGETATVEFNLATGLYLANRSEYMYMGDENEVWAANYSAYLKESYVVSFSYDDYDASYTSMQIDSLLASSNYLVARTSDIFDDYAISFGGEDASAYIKNLQYFDAGNALHDNSIPSGQKSYAYATALRQIAGDNLTKYRCVVTTNLADVMNVADFLDVIEFAGETTLGISNIGKAASLSVDEQNLNGRHGNRFIADYFQYGRRTVSGRRVWMTFAALVTRLLNDNYLKGNEARPPMGFTYGQIQCDELSLELTGAQRKSLVQSKKLNPAISEGGYYLWEEVTSQITDSSLSDIHVILSYCWMKYMIYQSMMSFVAEYNDVATVNEGLRVLQALNKTFIERNYIEEGKPNADKNIIGDTVMRFDFPVRFKGVARYVDIYVTAYPQTQSLEISLAEDA